MNDHGTLLYCDEAIRFIEKFEETRPHREVFVPDVERRKEIGRRRVAADAKKFSASLFA